MNVDTLYLSVQINALQCDILIAEFKHKNFNVSTRRFLSLFFFHCCEQNINIFPLVNTSSLIYAHFVYTVCIYMQCLCVIMSGF